MNRRACYCGGDCGIVECKATTTEAEPADVEIVWVDDDGSTIDHYEGE